MPYTVTWTVTKTVPTACPDYKPDPYTGEYPMMGCLVYHCKTITEDKSAIFMTKEDAESFIKSAPESCSRFSISEYKARIMF